MLLKMYFQQLCRLEKYFNMKTFIFNKKNIICESFSHVGPGSVLPACGGRGGGRYESQLCPGARLGR